MTTLRADADVIVLGSTLGGLVAGSYLARAGLRVVLLEEEAHRKRPGLLREPFLLPGLGRGGTVRRVIQELGLETHTVRETLRDTCDSLIEIAGIEPAKKTV